MRRKGQGGRITTVQVVELILRVENGNGDGNGGDGGAVHVRISARVVTRWKATVVS